MNQAVKSMTSNKIAPVALPDDDVKDSLQLILSSVIEIPHVGAYVVQFTDPKSQRLGWTSQILDSQLNFDVNLQEKLSWETTNIAATSLDYPINISQLCLKSYQWLYMLPIAPLSYENRLLVITNQLLETEQSQRLQIVVRAIASHLQLWQQQHCHQTKTAELESVLHSVEHQVRQSLGLVNLYLSLLEGHSLDSQCRHVTDNLRLTVTEIAERLTAILGQQKSPITALPVVDIRQLVSDRGQAFSLSLQAKNLTLKIPATTVWLQANPHQMGQIVDNLLCNAIAFSPDGGLIEWTWEQFDGEVLMQIADQGPGIPAAAVHDIFQPGYTRRPEGQGLGLSIVHKIVAELGGRIWVNNLARSGAQFNLIFPQTLLPQS